MGPESSSIKPWETCGDSVFPQVSLSALLMLPLQAQFQRSWERQAAFTGSCIETHGGSYIWSANNYTRLKLFSPLSSVCLPLLLHSCPATPSPICTNWMRSRKCPMIQISQPHDQFINLQFPCSHSPRIIHLEGPACFSPCGRNRIVDDWSRSSYPFPIPTPSLFIYPYALLADSVTSQHRFKCFTLAHFRLCLS